MTGGYPWLPQVVVEIDRMVLQPRMWWTALSTVMMTHRPASLILSKLPWHFCKFQSCLCKLHVESLLWYPSYQPWYPWPVFGLKQNSKGSISPVETSCLKEAIRSPWHLSLILMKWRWSSFVQYGGEQGAILRVGAEGRPFGHVSQEGACWGRLVIGDGGFLSFYQDICISIVS